VWLDLREKGTRLYGSYSRDHGVSWSKNTLIYESPETTICQCCDPSIAASGEHDFAVMFRNVSGGMRDMYLAAWRTNGAVSKAEKIGTGSWAIDGCPMDGGGIARYRNKTITAWRRDRTVFLDEAGQPEIPLGEGKDVSIAASAKGTYVAWTNSEGIQIHAPDQAKARCLSPTGSYPVLTELPDGSVLAAWEQDGGIHSRILE
jgi:hypothetical protein